MIAQADFLSQSAPDEYYYSPTREKMFRRYVWFYSVLIVLKSEVVY